MRPGGMASVFLFLPFLLLMVSTSAGGKEIEGAPDVSRASPPIALDSHNFEKAINGKSVFLKFFAPYCSHCQEMAPAWEKMQAEWENHPTALVAEIDCTNTEENEKWCSEVMNIQGFPTIRYGDGSMNGLFLEDFHGDRDYESLSKFAKETISSPICSPGNMNACDSETRKRLQNYWKMSVSKLDEEIKQKEKMIDETETTFSYQFQKMQEQYDRKALEVELVRAEVNRNIRIINSILQYKVQ